MGNRIVPFTLIWELLKSNIMETARLRREVARLRNKVEGK